MAPIQFNGIDYLYLSSLAGEHSHKGVDEARGKLLRTLSVVRCSIRYSQKLGNGVYERPNQFHVQ